MSPALQHKFFACPISARWTGSNTNPGNNAGQGKAGTDRSNMVQLHGPNYPEGTPKSNTFGHWGNSYPAHLSNSSLLGFSRSVLQTLATLDNSEYCRAIESHYYTPVESAAQFPSWMEKTPFCWFMDGKYEVLDNCAAPESQQHSRCSCLNTWWQRGTQTDSSA